MTMPLFLDCLAALTGAALGAGGIVGCLLTLSHIPFPL
jgi:hypothetical protein